MSGSVGAPQPNPTQNFLTARYWCAHWKCRHHLDAHSLVDGRAACLGCYDRHEFRAASRLLVWLWCQRPDTARGLALVGLPVLAFLVLAVLVR